MYVYSFAANIVTQESGTTEWVLRDADILRVNVSYHHNFPKNPLRLLFLCLVYECLF